MTKTIEQALAAFDIEGFEFSEEEKKVLEEYDKGLITKEQAMEKLTCQE